MGHVGLMPQESILRVNLYLKENLIEMKKLLQMLKVLSQRVLSMVVEAVKESLGKK